MIKQHTAQSLAKYLGKPVKFKSEPYFLEGIKLELSNNPQCIFLIKLNTTIDNIYSGCQREYVHKGDKHSVFPILKTYDRLLDINPETGNTFCEDIYKFESTKNFKVEIEYDGIYTENGERIINHEFEEIDLYLDKGFLNPFQLLEKLIQYGFGAIENKESPTGYVDLFGYPCVKDERE